MQTFCCRPTFCMKQLWHQVSRDLTEGHASSAGNFDLLPDAGRASAQACGVLPQYAAGAADRNPGTKWPHQAQPCSIAMAPNVGLCLLKAVDLHQGTVTPLMGANQFPGMLLQLQVRHAADVSEGAAWLA